MHTMQTEADKSQHVTFRMPASLVAELRLVAKENDRSLSAEARLALRAWLTATNDTRVWLDSIAEAQSRDS